jgi:hypothetical protein
MSFIDRTILISVVIASGLSCNKLLDAPPPSADIDAKSVYVNDATAGAAIIGFYNAAMDNPQGILNGDISLYAALSADELSCVFPNAREDSFYQNRLTAANSLSGNLFSSGYGLIYPLNSILYGLDHSSGVTAATKTQLGGEARFLRALLYLYLVNLYGAVPEVVGTDYTVNQQLPRAAVDSIYALVMQDLQVAQQSLPAAYLTANGYAGDRTRPVQAAATALLARVECYRQLWPSAEQAASAVINDARYLLEPQLDSVFLATSREAIWQLQPVYDTLATADAKLFLPAGSGVFRIPQYALTPALLGSFQPGDLRRMHWCGGFGTRVYPYKYKQAGYHAGHAEYEMVLRLAEQYLLRAEARAHQGNLAGALSDLNQVRTRAGLTPSTATGVDAVLAAIFAERRVELFTEWGHRWLDLQRTGQADAVLPAKNDGWQSFDILYPIPGFELADDVRITQNPGY